MIKGINESKTLPKHTSCECKCRFDGKNFRLIKNGITVNVGESTKIRKTIVCAKKITVGIVLHALVEIANI